MRSLIARPGAFRWLVAGALVTGLWLLGTAMPVAADGGPHVSLANSGISTLTADGCAGCHRAHTAQGEGLLIAGSDVELCLACHGEAGTGATTNVEGGVQYAAPNDGTGSGAIAGALRAGGFVDARIDSAHSSRKSYPVGVGTAEWTSFSSWIKVLTTAQPVTSAHMNLDGPGRVASHNKAWGNGAINSGAGPTADISCTSCHNPHGNGQYRILNPLPTGTGIVTASTAAPVTDAALPSGTGAAATRNYTVQWGRTLADVLSGAYNWQNQGTADPYAGDYWRKYQPWNIVPVPGPRGPALPAGGSTGDTPMYVPGSTNLTAFTSEITPWCAACHTRYMAGGNPPTSSGDAIYNFRHQTDSTECTQCHVSHGSNAAMPGAESGPMAYPDGSAPTSVTSGQTTTYLNSRLLKIDNRGTCQACHDPTGTQLPDGSVITH
jgi:predicted CXXCH cytochrome family protein